MPKLEECRVCLSGIAKTETFWTHLCPHTIYTIHSVLNNTVTVLLDWVGGPNGLSNILASASVFFFFNHICFETLQDLDISICRIFLV